MRRHLQQAGTAGLLTWLKTIGYGKIPNTVDQRLMVHARL